MCFAKGLSMLSIERIIAVTFMTKSCLPVRCLVSYFQYSFFCFLCSLKIESSVRNGIARLTPYMKKYLPCKTQWQYACHFLFYVYKHWCVHFNVCIYTGVYTVMYVYKHWCVHYNVCIYTGVYTVMYVYKHWDYLWITILFSISLLDWFR